MLFIDTDRNDWVADLVEFGVACILIVIFLVLARNTLP